ncbi:restriction endonuclease subunit S [uncultured Methanobrevibacter sp.]|uniref:restriction endonuclease subunit S n=1 Tax=uncultured Methanobrevibacter sp. TaxID=253161 RepID=UPI0025DBF549|nr:restriction endonuclease subunit S [uncultured Methanobrevibacter sp.]
MSLILNDVAKFVTSKIEISEIDETNYISTENMLPNKGGVIEASSLPDTQTVREYQSSDILINNIRPYFKKIWFSDKNGGCSNDVFVLRAKNNYDSKFLYYVLSSDDFFSYVMSTAKGTKMPRGDKKAIQNYNVPEFPIEDQMKISNLLNGIDQKIEVNKKINNHLEEIILEIFDRWFVKFELSDELKSSKLGLIPKGWDIDYLGSKKSCTIIGSGIRNFEDSKIYIATADVDNSIITYNENLITMEDKPSRANMQPVPKSIWFAKMIDSRKLIMVDEYSSELLDNYIFSTGFCGLKCVDKYFYYLWTFLLTDAFNTMKNNFCTGTTMQAINNKDTKLIEFVLPDDNLLSQFNSIAEPIFKEIYYNNNEIKKLQNLRDILLPKLMSGEIDVAEINYDLKRIIRKFILSLLNYLYENKNYFKNTKSNETLLKSRTIHKIDKYFTKFIR